MKIRVSITLFLVILGRVANVAAAPTSAAIAPLVSGLGDHHYPVSNCSGPAQAFFDQGLRLFYGFRYPESLASFQEASRLDKDCAMTHWGEALAAGPTPNSRYLGAPDDPKGAAAAAVQRAMALRDDASPKEQALIEALALLYEETKTRNERDRAYATAMQNIYDRYRNDNEIATFYAAALMTKSAWDYWTPDGKPRPGTLDAQAALSAVLDTDIDHPGANHFYIHLLEDSQNPEAALPHAERLADTMPLVGHMVHMPSHIYIRTGLYAKSIVGNERSIDAANAFLEAWGDFAVPMGVPSLSSSDRNHAAHATDFIHLAAVLQGDYASAIKMANKIAHLAEPNQKLFGGFQRRVVKPLLTYRRFGKWQEILALPALNDSFPFPLAMWRFVRASAAANTGNIEQARIEQKELRALKELDAMRDLNVWVNSASALLRIADHIVSAEIAKHGKSFDQAIYHYERAIRLEDGLNYMEPPDWGHPVRLELGDLLIRLGRAQEAETVFWEDLRRNPENGWSLHGVWQSLRAQGLGLQASEIQQRFERAWSSADTLLENGRASAIGAVSSQQLSLKMNSATQ